MQDVFRKIGKEVIIFRKKNTVYRNNSAYIIIIYGMNGFVSPGQN